MTRLHIALLESWPVKKLEPQQDRCGWFSHGQLSGSTHPKVWPQALHSIATAPAALGSTCTAGLLGREANRQPMKPMKHGATDWSHATFLLAKVYLRSPLRSSIGMVDIRQICSALEIFTSLQGPVGASCKSWFLPQLCQGGMDPVFFPQTTFISPFVPQNMPQLWGSTVYLFLLLPCTNNPLQVKSLQLLKYIIPLAGKQRELSMRQLMRPF